MGKSAKRKVFLIFIMFSFLFCMSFVSEGAGSYLISNSDSAYLSELDVQGFSLQEINYAKNEIYARHGRKFLSVELTEYFNAQPWYSGYIAPEEFQDSILNEVERANAEFLRTLEFSRHTDGYQLDQPGYDISAVRTMQGVNREAVLTEGDAEKAVTNYFIQQYIEGYINPDAETAYTYWISYRTTGVKVKYVVDPVNGDVYEYGPYFGVDMPLGDTVSETYLFSAFDFLGDEESYKTGLVSSEKIESMKAGNIEFLGTWFYLDFDEDGVSESVSFLADGVGEYYRDLDHCTNCMLFVESEHTELQGDSIHCGCYGVSLDGRHIWLILADDGPSDDPVCTFYSYENKTLQEVGTLNDWVDNLTVTNDGMIYGRIGCRVWDTGLIDVSWKLCDDGFIRMVDQEYYRMDHFTSDYCVTSVAPVFVYEERDHQSTEMLLYPQKIDVLYTDAERWVYLEGEDGTAGWFDTETMDMTERMRVFQGLFIAD